jgi:cytochrome c oxidase assembly protein subunit 15
LARGPRLDPIGETATAPSLARGPRLDPIGETRRRRYGAGITALIFTMILTGGLVAGTRAGFSYNTFPLMGEGFFPVGVFAQEPWWINFFENVATVQLGHRLLAYLLMLVIPLFWWAARRHARAPCLRWAAHGLLAVLALQVGLGIGTLLYGVPVPLAAAHQAGALALFTLALYITHGLRRFA